MFAYLPLSRSLAARRLDWPAPERERGHSVHGSAGHDPIQRPRPLIYGAFGQQGRAPYPLLRHHCCLSPSLIITTPTPTITASTHPSTPLSIPPSAAPATAAAAAAHDDDDATQSLTPPAGGLDHTLLVKKGLSRLLLSCN